MLREIGSFWSQLYAGRDLVLSYVAATLENYKQVFADLVEAGDTLSRQKIPVKHVQNWLPNTFLASQRNNTVVSLPRFDAAGEAFDGSPQLFFDTQANRTNFTYPWPADQDCWILTNQIKNPSVILFKNIDYTLDLDAGAITFLADPFANSLFPQTTLFAEGLPSDISITLWQFKTQVDTQLVQTYFAYLVDMYGPSTQNFKNAVNAVLDAVNSCTSLLSVLRLISAVTDIPIVKTDGETIVDIGGDPQGQLVITDKNIYRFANSATITTTIGSVHQAGDVLTDSFEYIDFKQGQVPVDLPMLAVGKEFLASGYAGELLFLNQPEPTTVSEVDGHPFVSFPLLGQPADIALFWDTVFANGQATPPDLYTLLQRAFAGVPATVNPLLFLAQNLFRDNVVVLRLQVADYGANALDISLGPLLRKILPPRMGVIILLELQLPPISVTMGNVQDTPGTLFDGMDPLSTSAGSTVTSYFINRYVADICGN